MKNRKLSFFALGLFLAIAALYGANACIEGGPYYGGWSDWQLIKCGTLVNPGRLEFNQKVVPIGDGENVVPKVLDTVLADGAKKRERNVSYDCKSGETQSQTKIISYTPEVRWEPSVPSASQAGIFHYQAFVRGVSSDPACNSTEWEKVGDYELVVVKIDWIDYTEEPIPVTNGMVEIEESKIDYQTYPIGYEYMVEVEINDELIYVLREKSAPTQNSKPRLSKTGPVREKNDATHYLEAEPIEFTGRVGISVAEDDVDPEYCDESLLMMERSDVFSPKLDGYIGSIFASTSESNLRSHMSNNGDAEDVPGRSVLLTSMVVETCGEIFTLYYYQIINHGGVYPSSEGLSQVETLPKNVGEYLLPHDYFFYEVLESSLFYMEHDELDPEEYEYSGDVPYQFILQSMPRPSRALGDRYIFSEEFTTPQPIKDLNFTKELTLNEIDLHGNVNSELVDVLELQFLESGTNIIISEADFVENFSIEGIGSRSRAGGNFFTRGTFNLKPLRFTAANLIYPTTATGYFNLNLRTFISDNFTVPLIPEVTGDFDELELDDLSVIGSATPGNATIGLYDQEMDVALRHIGVKEELMTFIGVGALSIDLLDNLTLGSLPSDSISFVFSENDGAVLNGSVVDFGPDGGQVTVEAQLKAEGFDGYLTASFVIKYDALNFKANNILVETNSAGTFDKPFQELLTRDFEHDLDIEIHSSNGTIQLENHRITGAAGASDVVVVEAMGIQTTLHFRYLNVPSAPYVFGSDRSQGVSLEGLISTEVPAEVSYSLSSSKYAGVIGKNLLFEDQGNGFGDVVAQISLPGVDGVISKNFRVIFHLFRFKSDEMLVETDENGFFILDVRSLLVQEFAPSFEINKGISSIDPSIVSPQISGTAGANDFLRIEVFDQVAELKFRYLKLNESSVRFTGTEAIQLDLRDYFESNALEADVLSMSLRESRNALLSSPEFRIGQEGGYGVVDISLSIPDVYGSVLKTLPIFNESLNFKAESLNVIPGKINLLSLMQDASPAEGIIFGISTDIPGVELLDGINLDIPEGARGEIIVDAEHLDVISSTTLVVDYVENESLIWNLQINEASPQAIDEFFRAQTAFDATRMVYRLNGNAVDMPVVIERAQRGYVLLQVDIDTDVAQQDFTYKIGVQSIELGATAQTLFGAQSIDLRSFLLEDDLNTRSGVSYSLVGAGASIEGNFLNIERAGDYSITFQHRGVTKTLNLKVLDEPRFDETQILAKGNLYSNKRIFDSSGADLKLRFIHEGGDVYETTGTQFRLDKEGLHSIVAITNPGKPGEKEIPLQGKVDVVNLEFTRIGVDVLPNSGLKIDLKNYLASGYRPDLIYFNESQKYLGLSLGDVSQWEYGNHQVTYSLKEGERIIKQATFEINVIDIEFKTESDTVYVTATDGLVDLKRFMRSRIENVEYSIRASRGAQFSYDGSSSRVDLGAAEGSYKLTATYTGAAAGVQRETLKDTMALEVVQIGFSERDPYVAINDGEIDLRSLLLIPESVTEVFVDIGEYFTFIPGEEFTSGKTSVRDRYRIFDQAGFNEMLLQLSLDKQNLISAYLNKPSRVWTVGGGGNNPEIEMGYGEGQFKPGRYYIRMTDNEYGRSDVLYLNIVSIEAFTVEQNYPDRRHKVAPVINLDDPNPLFLRALVDTSSGTKVHDVTWIKTGGAFGSTVDPVGRFIPGSTPGVTKVAAYDSKNKLRLEKSIALVDVAFQSDGKYISDIGGIDYNHLPKGEGLHVTVNGLPIQIDEDAKNEGRILEFVSPTHRHVKDLSQLKIQPGERVDLEAYLGHKLIDKISVYGQTEEEWVPAVERDVLLSATDSIVATVQEGKSEFPGSLIRWISTNPQIISVDDQGVVTKGSLGTPGKAEIYFEYSKGGDKRFSKRITIYSVGMDKMYVDGVEVTRGSEIVVAQSGRSLSLELTTNNPDYRYKHGTLTWQGVDLDSGSSARLVPKFAGSRVVSVTDVAGESFSFTLRVANVIYNTCIPYGEAVPLASLFSIPSMTIEYMTATAPNSPNISIDGNNMVTAQTNGGGELSVNVKFDGIDRLTNIILPLRVAGSPVPHQSRVVLLGSDELQEYDLGSNVDSQFLADIEWGVSLNSEPVTLKYGRIIQFLQSGVYQVAGVYDSPCGGEVTFNFDVEVQKISIEVTQSPIIMKVGGEINLDLELSHGATNSAISVVRGNDLLDSNVLAGGRLYLGAKWGGRSALRLRYTKDGFFTESDDVPVFIDADINIEDRTVSVAIPSDSQFSYDILENLVPNEIYHGDRSTTNFTFESSTLGEVVLERPNIRLDADDVGLSENITVTINFNNGHHDPKTDQFSINLDFQGTHINDHYATYSESTEGYVAKVFFDVDTNPYEAYTQVDRVSGSISVNGDQETVSLLDQGKSIVRADHADGSGMFSLPYEFRHSETYLIDGKGPFFLEKDSVRGTPNTTLELDYQLDGSSPNAVFSVYDETKGAFFNNVDIESVPVDPYTATTLFIRASGLDRVGEDMIEINYSPRVQLVETEIALCTMNDYVVQPFGGTGPYTLTLESGTSVTIEGMTINGVQEGVSQVLALDANGHGQRLTVTVENTEYKPSQWGVLEEAEYVGGEWQLNSKHFLLVGEDRNIRSEAIRISYTPPVVTRERVIDRTFTAVVGCLSNPDPEVQTAEASFVRAYANDYSRYVADLKNFTGVKQIRASADFVHRYQDEVFDVPHNDIVGVKFGEPQYMYGKIVTAQAKSLFEPNCTPTLDSGSYENYMSFTSYPKNFGTVSWSFGSDRTTEREGVLERRITLIANYEGLSAAVEVGPFVVASLPDKNYEDALVDVDGPGDDDTVFIGAGEITFHSAGLYNFKLSSADKIFEPVWTVYDEAQTLVAAGTSKAIEVPLEQNKRYSVRVNYTFDLCDFRDHVYTIEIGEPPAPPTPQVQLTGYQYTPTGNGGQGVWPKVEDDIEDIHGNITQEVYPLNEPGDNRVRMIKFSSSAIQGLDEGDRVELLITGINSYKLYWIKDGALRQAPDVLDRTNLASDRVFYIRGGEASDNALVTQAVYRGAQVLSHDTLAMQFIEHGVDVESRDRVVSAKITVPAGVEDVDAYFLGPDGEKIGPFNNLLRLDGADQNGAFVYDDEEDVFSDLEIDSERNGSLDPRIITQDAFITRNLSSREISISTVFNSTGTSRLIVEYDGSEAYNQQTKLTPDADMSEYLIVVEDIVSRWRGLNSVRSKVSLAKGGTSDGECYSRGLLSRIVVDNLKGTLNVKVGLVKGVFNGFYDGVVDVGTELAETAEMIWSPYQTYCEIYLLVQELSYDDIAGAFQDSINDFLDESERSVTFELDSAIANDLAARAYITGYSFGYMSSQIAAVYVGAGAVAKAGKVVSTLSKQSKIIAGTVSAVNTAVAIGRKAKLAIYYGSIRRIKDASHALGVTRMLTGAKNLTLGSGEKLLEFLGARYSRWDGFVDEMSYHVYRNGGDWEEEGLLSLERLGEYTDNLDPNTPHAFFSDKAAGAIGNTGDFSLKSCRAMRDIVRHYGDDLTPSHEFLDKLLDFSDGGAWTRDKANRVLEQIDEFDKSNPADFANAISGIRAFIDADSGGRESLFKFLDNMNSDTNLNYKRAFQVIDGFKLENRKRVLKFVEEIDEYGDVEQFRLAKAISNPRYDNTPPMQESMIEAIDFLRQDGKLIKGIITKPSGPKASPLFNNLGNQGGRGFGFEPIAAKYLVDNGEFTLSEIREFGREFDIFANDKSTTIEADIYVEKESGELILYDVKNLNRTSLPQEDINKMEAAVLDLDDVDEVRLPIGAPSNFTAPTLQRINEANIRLSDELNNNIFKKYIDGDISGGPEVL